MKPYVSIIIVSWNTRELLRKCLNSIYSETKGITFEIFVVDNASSDKSVEMVAKEFPEVNLISNEKNLGFGRASNQAIKRCAGEYVLFLNPDTIILDKAIIKILNFMENHPNVGAAGPKTLYPNRTLQISWAKFPRLWTVFTTNVSMGVVLWWWGLFQKRSKKRLTMGNSDSWLEDLFHPKQVEVLYGEFIMTKKSILEQIGGFPEERFMYEEETDLCYRISKAGWEIWLVPESQIIHYGRQSIKQLPNFTKKEVDWYITGRSWFFRKYYGIWKSVAFHIFNCINSLFKLVLYQIMYFFNSNRRTRIKERLKWDSTVLLWYLKRIMSRKVSE